MGIAVEILAEKRAFNNIDLDIGTEPGAMRMSTLTRLLAVSFQARRRASGRQTSICREDVVPGRKRIRLMEADGAHRG